MSEIEVVRIHAGQREKQAPTTEDGAQGTRGWELFKNDAAASAVRVGGTLRHLAHELRDGWLASTIPARTSSTRRP